MHSSESKAASFENKTVNIVRNYSKSKNKDFRKIKKSEKVLKNKVVLKLKIIHFPN